MSKKSEKREAKKDLRQARKDERLTSIVSAAVERQTRMMSAVHRHEAERAAEQAKAEAAPEPAPALMTPKERFAALKSQGRNFDAAQLLGVHSKSILG